MQENTSNEWSTSIILPILKIWGIADTYVYYYVLLLIFVSNVYKRADKPPYVSKLESPDRSGNDVYKWGQARCVIKHSIADNL